MRPTRSNLTWIYCEGGVTADLGAFLTLSDGLGGGGGSVLSTEGEGLGVGEWRWFAFLLPGAEPFALSLDPNSPDEVPGTTPWLAFAFALRLAGLTDGMG